MRVCIATLRLLPLGLWSARLFVSARCLLVAMVALLHQRTPPSLPHVLSHSPAKSQRNL
ncbi:uncharacterized protein CC84DRAFT_1163182 [Paraphaeosphaeria sporulosa]|uniref:Uncharacterized protein n=1 Tax=Paraphaeosphaeria sporulosa TaxID=1460663 RepID=A0A177CH41_9PLEO|nr:uncharacterized protein CC84DRAFT_1163182 [Paraphaeosphaeria sporulosa]OAG06885.1 hypothetical protein CC84DRAFT_1163182 [Paraphaeosphaeria sporulosa]